MSAKRDLKAFVRLDSSNRVVPGSLIFRKHKPKEGRFMEIVIDPCCGPGVSALIVENAGTDPVVVNNINVPGGSTVVILPKFGLKLFQVTAVAPDADLLYEWRTSANLTVGTSGTLTQDVSTVLTVDQTLGIVKLRLTDTV